MERTQRLEHPAQAPQGEIPADQPHDVVRGGEEAGLYRCGAEAGPKPASGERMKQFVSNSVGWMASFLFITVATLLWSCTALCVWVCGNASLTGRS